MKIKLEEQSYISLKWIEDRIEELQKNNTADFGSIEWKVCRMKINELELVKQQLHPLKPLAEKCFDEGVFNCGYFGNTSGKNIDEARQSFLNSEIEL